MKIYWLIAILVLALFLISGCKKPAEMKLVEAYPVIQELKEKCSVSSMARYKIKCVFEETKKFYNYVEDDNPRETPQEVFEKGGNYLDWTNYYCGVFKSLEVNCQVVLVNETHSFALLSFEENAEKNVDLGKVIVGRRKTYCTIGGIDLKCW